MIWLSDIDSIDGLKSIARWLAFSLMEYPPGGRRSDFNPLDEETHHVQNPSSIVLVQVEGKSDMDSLVNEPHGWLSSTWTFQEALLRPDMWLCSKDWTILRLIDGDVGSTLELSGLIALCQQTTTPRKTDPTGVIAGIARTEPRVRMKCPLNVLTLPMVMMLSGMMQISDLTPSTKVNWIVL